MGDFGVYKTTNGGDSWSPRSGQRHFVRNGFVANKVAIHPAARNIVYAGGGLPMFITNGPLLGVSFGVSPDSGTTWTPLVDSQGEAPYTADVTPDPLIAGNFIMTTSFIESNPLKLRWPTGGAEFPFSRGDETIFRMQMVPDVDRTVVASLVSANGGAGRTTVFSFLKAQGASTVSVKDLGLIGPANVVYDASDGTQRLYVGGKALGRDPNLLYRAPVAQLLTADPTVMPGPWEELGGDDVFPSYQRTAAMHVESFSTLVIDPAGGGQTMYTLGSGSSLWQSRDGGHSWRRDDSVPGFVTGAWLSPADGALYANLAPQFADTSRNFFAGEGADAAPYDQGGLLWKRLATTGIVPGARMVRSDLRVTCTDQTGLVKGPGSTFAVGDTMLTCSATDAFGNGTFQRFTVTVRDTTPPVLTLPAPITVNPSGTGSTAVVTFTATATDLVSGSRPVTCTPASGSTFAAGATTVNCTASDAAGNPKAGSFTVTVNKRPVVTVPATITREATGASGAVVTFTASAADPEDGARSVTCTPASGTTFAIRTTTVTCTATDTRGLAGSATFSVVVRDTTGPTLTVPGPVTITACGASTNIGTPTATDLVTPSASIVITSDKPTGTAKYALGTRTVTYTARDAAGNPTVKTQTVTVILGDDSSCCPSGTTIRMGTAGNDNITGSSTGNDCIIGLGGDDTLNGSGGNDYISGGAGNDTINGGTGTDKCWGGSGTNTITACE